MVEEEHKTDHPVHEKAGPDSGPSLFMPELKEFRNEGFGWTCLRCEREFAEKEPSEGHSRLMHEGEAEGKSPTLSNKALARWHDPAHRILFCPRCGVSETFDLA